MSFKDSLRGAIIGAGALLAAVILALMAFDDWHLYQQLIAANKREICNLALVLATGTARKVQSADRLLLKTAAWYELAGHHQDAAAVDEALATFSAGPSQLDSLTIADRSGMQRYRAPASGEPLGDVADRGYFLRQRDDSSAGLVIDRPAASRSETTPALILSRALRGPHGEFDGIVSAVLSLQDLQATFDALRFSADSSLTLALVDGTIVIQASSREGLPVEARALRLLASVPVPRMVRVVSPADGRVRLVVAQRVGDGPLFVAVARGERDVLGPWYDEMLGSAGRAIAAMLLVLIAVLGLLRRHQRLQQLPLEGHERAAKAMEAASEGYFDWNVREGTVAVSGQWLVLHGLDRRQAIHAIEDVRHSVRIHADDCQALRTVVDEHLQGRSPRIDADYRVLRQDGSWTWLQLRGRSVRDDAGAAARLFCTVQDISARKDAEISRVALETHLQQTHHMEALGTLAGGVAHDFNNLLAAILGFGGLAREQAAEDSQIRRHLDRVLQAGWRGRAIVQRVMQFSRTEPAERACVDIQDVVEEAIAVLPPLPEGISLQAALDVRGVRVMGDTGQLLQVVANLCMNAVEAVDGCGWVRLRLAAVRLDEARSFLHGELGVGSYVRLDVEDSGQGVSPETIGRMFEPFFTTRLHGEGTGLGLSVVHGVVIELAGAIDVRSALGAGTLISVWLPVAPTLVATAAKLAAAGTADPQVVAIVDDEPMLIELAEEMIVKLGYIALPFHSSEQARTAFEDARLRVDLLLTDEKMPGLSGSELIGAIRARGWDIPVIVMSGNVTTELEQRARANGVCALLHKPLSREMLAAALARCLRPPGP